MLTGLLFAIEEAVDDPARLVATLPFAGSTLIEHQARQLVVAGAAQIVIVGDRHTPELLGALHRIARRGVAVDAVRGAADAAAAVHPLARVLLLADGLVTVDAAVRLLAGEGGDALLTVPIDEAAPGFERIGGASAWAGAARVTPQRLAELARLPADYDPQSTLIRLAEAAGAARLPLPAAALRDGHGIERDVVSLRERGRRIIAAAIATPRGWFDRFVTAPIVRSALPPLLARRIETAAVAVVATVLTAGSLALLGLGWWRTGLLSALAAVLIGRLGAAAADLRGENGWTRRLAIGGVAFIAAPLLMLGWRCGAARGDGTAPILAATLVVAALLVERTGPAAPAWWGGPVAVLAVVAAVTVLGAPVTGLGVATVYAAVMLALAIEQLRQPA